MNKHTLTSESALCLLREATHETSGIFSMLRSGVAPPECELERLRSAAEVMQHHFANCDVMPRVVTVICAIFMHFRGECERNLHSKSGPRYCLDAVLELEQIAFNTLAR